MPVENQDLGRAALDGAFDRRIYLQGKPFTGFLIAGLSREDLAAADDAADTFHVGENVDSHGPLPQIMLGSRESSRN